MSPGDARLELGKRGEDVACDELRRRGYAILARRYRTRLGELDIVAREGGTLVFVEVKTRTSRRCGGAAEAVDARKQQRLVRMAHEFLLRAGLTRVPCRFDVVAVDCVPVGPARVEVFVAAFDTGR